MSQNFNVSRMTIRKAVDYLVRQGILDRRQGQGTFVRLPTDNVKISLPLDRHLSTSETAHSLKGSLKSIVLSFSRIDAPDDIADLLRIPPKTPVYAMTRLRLINDIPFVYEQSHMIALPFPDLNGTDLEGSKYAYLEKRGFRVKGSKKEIRAELPQREVREKLRLERDEPVLTALSVAFFEDGTPFEVSIIHYNQKHYTFTLNTGR